MCHILQNDLPVSGAFPTLRPPYVPPTQDTVNCTYQKMLDVQLPGCVLCTYQKLWDA